MIDTVNKSADRPIMDARLIWRTPADELAEIAEQAHRAAQAERQARGLDVKMRRH